MEYLITESQYHYLKQILSEQTYRVLTKKPTPKKPVVKKKPVIVTTTTTATPITTTTTTEIQKTIIPEPYFDKNTERAVKAECNMTFVGKKGKTTFDRIHKTSDGKFLGDYDKSLSLDFNIRKFCKK